MQLFTTDSDFNSPITCIKYNKIIKYVCVQLYTTDFDFNSPITCIKYNKIIKYIEFFMTKADKKKSPLRFGYFSCLCTPSHGHMTCDVIIACHSKQINIDDRPIT